MDEIKLFKSEDILISLVYSNNDITDNKNSYVFGDNMYEYVYRFIVHRQELERMVPKFTLHVYFNTKPHDINVYELKDNINYIIASELTHDFYVLRDDDMGKMLSEAGIVVYSIDAGNEYIVNPVFDGTHIRFRHNMKGGNSSEQYQNSSN